MSLTAVNAAISIKNGTAAPVNLSPGDVGIFTPGSPLVFALQNTRGIQRAEFTLLCPTYPGLHQLTYSWSPGQYNGWQITFPESAVVDVASTIAGVNLVVTVTDCSASSVTASNYLESFIYWADGSHIAPSGISIGDACTLHPSGIGMVVASTANLAASPSQVVECVALANAVANRPFIATNDGRLTPSQAPFVGTAAPADFFAVVDASGHIVRDDEMGTKCIGICAVDGSVTICLALFGGHITGGGPAPGTPTVTAISPSMAFRLASGVAVSITGTGFVTGASVVIGGIACTSVFVSSPTLITCVTGTFSSAGAKDVVVTNTGGTPGTLVGGYVPIASALWLDPSDPTTVTLVGAGVSQLADRSGNARHFAQVTAGARPTIQTNAFGTKSAVRYTAATMQSLLGPTLSSLTAGEMFVVLAVNNEAAVNGPWQIGNCGGVFYTFGGAVYDGFGSITRQTSTDPGVDQAQPNVYHTISTSTEYTAYMNGAAPFFTTASNIVGWEPGGSLLGVTTGGGMTITPGTAFFYDGVMGEMVVFPSKLSTGDRNAVIAYYNAKYGTPI